MAAPGTTARPRILFVDDDRLIRTAYDRQLRARFDVVTAETGEEALAVLKAGPPFIAVMSDLQMPGMDGLALLDQVRSSYPETKRVLFSGKADLRTLTQAVNELGVFRVLLKPCPPAQLWECLDAVVASSKPQETKPAATVTPSPKAVESDVSELVTVWLTMFHELCPPLHARAQRLRACVRHVAVALALGPSERYELAAMISGVGLLTLDRGALERFTIDRPIDQAERKRFQGTWLQAATIIRSVAAFKDIADMVGAAGGTVPQYVAKDPIVLGSQLLRTVVEFDGHLARGAGRAEALATMRRDALSPLGLIDGLMDLPCRATRTTVQERHAADLERGMILEEPVRADNGLTLVPAGRTLTPALIQLIEGYSRTLGIVEPLLVRTTTLQPVVGAETEVPAV